MADKAFPSVNDLGGGKTITEANLRDFIAGLMNASGAFVVSGFVIPGSSASLSITIPLGVCYIDGYRIEADAEAISLGANLTHFIYLQYSIDGSSNITSHGLTSNTTGIAPARSILLAKAVAGASTITSTTDRRKVGFSVFSGYQPQALTEASIAASSSGDTNIINVTEQGHLTSFYLEASGVTGGGSSTTLSLKIQIDGSTVNTLTLGTIPAASALTISQQATALAGLANVGASKVVIPLNIFYRVSCKVDLNASSTGTGNYTVKLQRSKAV